MFHVLFTSAAALGDAMMELGSRCLTWQMTDSPATSGVQALGISVEFCAHVLHAFVVAPGSRQERMVAAVSGVGASVLSGIILTKIVGKHQQHPASVLWPQPTASAPSWACSSALPCVGMMHTAALLSRIRGSLQSPVVPT